ncbi:hypothetical protein PA7559_04220 [Pseudoalteromonas distincta]
MGARTEYFLRLKVGKDLTIKRLVTGIFIVFKEYFVYTNLHKSNSKWIGIV